MFRKAVVSLIGAFLFVGPAGATCSRTTLTNGTTADANQVMNDLNCLAPLTNPTFSDRVGIGIAPDEPLTVFTNPEQSTNIHVGIYTYLGTDYSAWSTILGSNVRARHGATRGMELATNYTGGAAAIQLGHSIEFDTASSAALSGYTAGTPFSFPRMIIDASGNVGIGTTSPDYKLQVNGTVAGSSAYVNLSDERLKKDIHPIQNALKIIEQIHGVSFRWKTPSERRVGKKFDLPVDKPQIGFIAQNLEKVLPQAVSVGKGKDAIMTVAESKVVPVLVEAVKQLKAANDKLTLANAKQADALHRLEIQVRAVQHHETEKAAVIR